MRKNPGFTLIEVMIVILIVTIVAGLGLFFGLDFYRTYAIDSERDTLVSALRRSRMRALDNVNGAPHGLKIGAQNFILYTGNSYAGRNPAFDESISRSAAVNIAGLDDIVFGSLSATSSYSGTVTLSDGVRQRTININYEGGIDW